MAGKIQDEEGYERSMKWLVDVAAKLEDPLLTSEDDILDGKTVKYWRQAYDLVTEQVQSYRRGKWAVEYPGLAERYETLGWKYNKEGGV